METKTYTPSIPHSENMNHPEKGENIFTVDETSDLPIWVQLRNRMAYLIRTHYFKPGEQIPSVRSLSAAAKINYNTVTKSYKDLEQSNMIVSIRGRGMYVNKVAPKESGTEEAAVDIVIEDCIQHYRSLGMTYEEIRDRISEITFQIENKSTLSTERKMGFNDA